MKLMGIRIRGSFFEILHGTASRAAICGYSKGEHSFGMTPPSIINLFILILGLLLLELPSPHHE